MKRFMQNYNPRSMQYRDIVEAEDGDYVLHSEAQSRIATLEAALRATVAYMKDDSGGYEVYKATLEAAEQALGDL